MRKLLESSLTVTKELKFDKSKLRLEEATDMDEGKDGLAIEGS